MKTYYLLSPARDGKVYFFPLTKEELFNDLRLKEDKLIYNNDFNKNVNPKIIQRKARHKKIESTLRYDHTSDEMVRKHFESQRIGIDDLDDKGKARLLFNRYLSGEVDIETFKQGLEVLTEKERKHYVEVGYV